MDTFHRVDFTGTWRRLFSRVKKHVIWGVLKSVTGMQVSDQNVYLFFFCFYREIQHLLLELAEIVIIAPSNMSPWSPPFMANIFVSGGLGLKSLLLTFIFHLLSASLHVWMFAPPCARRG